MTRSGYLFLGLTAIVGALAGLLAFAAARLIAGMRETARAAKMPGGETAFMAAAMEAAVRKLRDGERALKARAEASERLSSEIIASLTSGLLVVDVDGAVRTLNPAGRALLRVGEATGDYRTVLQGAGALVQVIDEVLRTGRPVVRRTVQVAAPGGTSHLGVTVSPIRDDAPAHGAICLFTDLSDVVELEEQLRLKDSLARLGELTAGIAHEFRNGLATIHGYGRLLDPDRMPPEFRPCVEGIRQETESLGQIVTNFLNFARPADLVLTPVDMDAIVDRAADDIRDDVLASGGTVEVRGEFCRVDGDEVLLRQAFSNLCRNALEACCEAKVAPQIVIEGSCDRGHGVLRIDVVDNGPGIDESRQARMFRPFFTTKARGTGLGLALVQKIVVTHNGRVTAANADRGGARLTVVLPVPAR